MAGKIIFTTVYGRRVLIHMYEDRIEHIRVINDDSSYPIGTVIVGRVKKMLPSSNACFVDIGTGTDYFMTIPVIPGSILYANESGKRSLGCEDQILVRIATEKIKSKAPTVEPSISINGRYVVIENGRGLSFSKKISAADRKKFIFNDELNTIFNKCHVVIRTQAGNLDDLSILYDEIFSIFKEYEKIISRSRCCALYTSLYTPAAMLESTITDWLKYEVDEIITDEVQFKDRISAVLETNNHMNLRLYDDDRIELVKLYKLETLLDEITGKKVYMKSGGFLVVEQGETLTAIDVNSGHAIKGDKEDTTFKINIEAATEIGRILKNRNLSGMILIDFINMKDSKHEKELVDYMKTVLSKDDVRARFIDMTGLGLMEVTRQRVNMTFIEQWKS